MSFKNTLNSSLVKWLSALIVIPALVYLPLLFNSNHTSQPAENGFATWSVALRALLVYVPLLFLALFYWSDGILKRDWLKWRQHVWKNLLSVIVVVIFIFIVIMPLATVFQKILGGSQQLHLMASINFFHTALPTLIVFTIPLMQAFTEEIVYHHALVAPFVQNKGLYFGMSVVSNIIFGFVHINNVSGNLPALALYFLVGATFQIFYLLSKKNIWQNIMAHLFYNGSITLLGVVGILVSLIAK
ncbi:CPBP family glutamic-type intramembrane protease [Furfurilactobacillus entadae]|uniref:CPBP family glutamic-type intramembrane protease n=1 Tax=Furfurilactobacillus entadae TaxID=2922307 RepID=UPI0035EA396B